MNDDIANMIQGYMGEIAAAVEKCCEAALQGGVCGVLVVHHRDGSTTVSVDPSVPYGHIYERQWYDDES